MRLRIKELRAQLGWTLDDLAEHSGISQPVLSRLQTGKQQYKQEHLRALAQAFSVSPSALLDDTDGIPIIGEISDEDNIQLMRLGAYNRANLLFNIDNIDESFCALHVLSNAMAPLYYATDFLIYAQRHREIREQDVGRPCVCTLPNGELAIKILKKSADPGKWRLDPINQFTSPIWAVDLVSAARVIITVPLALAAIDGEISGAQSVHESRR